MINSEYRQPTHREELERELVHGASSQIAHAPENAAAIAKGIKTVLDELAPKMASGIVIPPIGAPSAGVTAASLSFPVIERPDTLVLHVPDRGPACTAPAPTDSHASTVLYPAIERAMAELGKLHPAFNFAVNRAFNHLHDAFWSECPAPASAAPKRPDFPGV